ncbi:MAG: peptidase M20 [Rhodospirillaceae bacterium]|nr:peptidase M20 [Rhodospirillaceae bacterium]
MSNTIAAFLDAEQERQIAFLAALVKSPTDNPPGDCADHAELTHRLLEELGFEVEAHPVPREAVHAAGMISATNLIIRHRFGDGPTIALNAHGDVVPPGSGWDYDPYGAEIEETGGSRRMYGRGAAVSKSDFASYTWALLALRKAAADGVKLAGTVELHFTYDEEIGGTVGPQWILEQGLSSPDYVICAGFSHAVITAHNGCLHLEATVTGKIGHAAEPERAVDALEVSNAVLSALYDSRSALLDIRSDVPGIENPTLVIGTIEGGINTNVVPDSVTFRIDRRILPEESVDAVERELVKIIQNAVAAFPGASASWRRIMAALPLVPQPGWKKIADVIRCAASDVAGEEIPYVGAKLFTDARLYAEKGIPVVLYGAGPRTLAEAGGHNSDENLDLADLRLGTEVVALAIVALLTP